MVPTTHLSQQGDGDLHRRELALIKAAVDDLAELRVCPAALFPQQVSSRQVCVAVVLRKTDTKGCQATVSCPGLNFFTFLNEVYLIRGST